MVAEREKWGNLRSISRLKQAKKVGKRVLYNNSAHSQLACDEKRRPFSEEWHEDREKIQETVSLYRELLVDKEKLVKLSQEHGKGPEKRQYGGLRFHMKVAMLLEKLGKCVNDVKQFGHVSGIKVGDKFLWRGELRVVGLHHEFEKGIHYMKLMNGKILATSVVESGIYENAADSDQLYYCGEGENPNLLREGKKPKDQKLTGGNLALKNSMDNKMPVRVIRRRTIKGNDLFVYDGLYRVTAYWKEKGKFGTHVYKFCLKKTLETSSSSSNGLVKERALGYIFVEAQ